jgi:hypothetical protein
VSVSFQKTQRVEKNGMSSFFRVLQKKNTQRVCASIRCRNPAGGQFVPGFQKKRKLFDAGARKGFSKMVEAVHCAVKGLCILDIGANSRASKECKARFRCSKEIMSIVAQDVGVQYVIAELHATK